MATQSCRDSGAFGRLLEATKMSVLIQLSHILSHNPITMYTYASGTHRTLWDLGMRAMSDNHMGKIL